MAPSNPPRPFRLFVLIFYLILLLASSNADATPPTPHGASAWPPWPFNALSSSSSSSSSFGASPDQSLLSSIRGRAQSVVTTSSVVVQQATRHLPPALGPLIALSVLPAPQSRLYLRRVVLASAGASVLSWSHAELRRYSKLASLPLSSSSASLPPFLPPVPPQPAPPTPPDLPFKGSFLTDFATQQVTRLQANRREREYIRLREIRNGAYKSLTASPPTPPAPSMGYAVVTGASSGLGRSLSVELARRKIPLVLVARNAAALSALASDLARCYKIQAIPVPLDLSDPAAVPQLTRKLAELDKPVDILVSNAGSCERSPFLASKRSAPSLRLMVNSATELARAVLPGMADRKRGRVLFVGSLMSAAGTGPGVAQYAASKAYLATFARSLAKEMEPHGVGVTLTSPGAIRSGFFDSMDGDALCNRIPFYPMSSEAVADRSVRAMVAGLTEVMPGWQNRALAAGTPWVPGRVLDGIVERAWKPLLGGSGGVGGGGGGGAGEEEDVGGGVGTGAGEEMGGEGEMVAEEEEAG